MSVETLYQMPTGLHLEGGKGEGLSDQRGSATMTPPNVITSKEKSSQNSHQPKPLGFMTLEGLGEEASSLSTAKELDKFHLPPPHGGGGTQLSTHTPASWDVCENCKTVSSLFDSN